MDVSRKPLFVLDQDCLSITNRVIEEVRKAGMQIMRSFDLKVRRSSGRGDCCPIHGENTCACHVVILLIMRHELGSLTVILEGVDQQTSVYFDSGPETTEDQVDPSLTRALLNAFFPKKLIH